MAKITGIGGIFIQTKNDVTNLLNWYRDVLNLDITEYGINFLIPNELTLVTFNKGQGETVLNFTVDDLESFMVELKSKNVLIEQEIETYDYGKFAKIKDPFGTTVELWQPYQENYIQMVNKEIKDYKNKTG